MSYAISSAVPETPHHCHIANQTLIGIRVVCDTGFDGGLEQTFHMEVMAMAENVMYANRSVSAQLAFIGLSGSHKHNIF